MTKEKEFILYKGGHDDLHRIYPMMQFDFERFRLADERTLQRALWDEKAELWLLKDEDMMEHGYFYALTACPMRYVMGMWLGIYPNYRRNGDAGRFVTLIAEHYKDKQGILCELPTLREDTEYLAPFLKKHGYEETGIPLALGGRENLLLCMNVLATAKMTVPVARLILKDLYEPLMSGAEFEKRVQIG